MPVFVESLAVESKSVETGMIITIFVHALTIVTLPVCEWNAGQAQHLSQQCTADAAVVHGWTTAARQEVQKTSKAKAVWPCTCAHVPEQQLQTTSLCWEQPAVGHRAPPPIEPGFAEPEFVVAIRVVAIFVQTFLRKRSLKSKAAVRLAISAWVSNPSAGAACFLHHRLLPLIRQITCI